MTDSKICHTCGGRFEPTDEQLARRADLICRMPPCKLTREFPRCCADCQAGNFIKAMQALLAEEEAEQIEQGKAIGEGAI